MTPAQEAVRTRPDTNRERKTLISVHIPKTGGVTFRSAILAPAFGDRLLLDYDDHPLANETSVRNARAQAFVPDDELLSRYDCIHGHFLATKYAGSPSCEFAVWLRDPVQRYISRYHYGQREGGLAGITFAEFCQIERYHNTYASYLWSFDLDRFDFVGITEDYARSLGIFCRRFDIPINAEGAHNVNPQKGRDGYDVSADTRRLIERHNELDLTIYAAGRRHLASLEARHST